MKSALWAVMTLLSLCSSCSVMWALSADETGLACGPDDGSPRCLEGWACVQEKCVKAGFKAVNELCEATIECQDGLVCGDGYAGCADDLADDLNCALFDDAQSSGRCRPRCDPDAPNCADGQRCFASNSADDGGYCQVGTCGEDGDCQGIAGSLGLCAGMQGDGLTGLCLEQCDPLTCAAGACSGCDGLDDQADDNKTCVPVPGEGVSSRTVCDAMGSLTEGQDCGAGTDFCGLGLFCLKPQVGNAVCAKWCRLLGGNPACDVGRTCTGVTATLGFCQ